MLELTEANQGQTVETVVGEEIRISLAENPTTGFRWRIIDGGEPVCTLLDQTLEPGSRAIGQPGVHRWQYKITGEGMATIRLACGRSWEAGKAPVSSFVLRINAKTKMQRH
jgi:inhibitor of cysteine peptidase